MFFQQEIVMKFSRSVYSLATAATLGFAALGASASAQAGDVYWSVGVSQPGVQVGVSNAPPVVYHPAPVVMYPQPHVVYAPPPPPPRVIYRPAPVYHAPPQVVYVPQPYYTQAGWVYPGQRRGWYKHHGPQGGWDRDGRGGYNGHNNGYPGPVPAPQQPRHR